MTKFKEAAEVREIAEDIIDKYHPHLQDAKDVIGYYFREGASDWVEKYEPADKADSWSIREHDVEEFSDIIKRHGLWDTGIEKFAAAVREADYQMSLDDIEREENRVLRAVK